MLVYLSQFWNALCDKESGFDERKSASYWEEMFSLTMTYIKYKIAHRFWTGQYLHHLVPLEYIFFFILRVIASATVSRFDDLTRLSKCGSVVFVWCCAKLGRLQDDYHTHFPTQFFSLLKQYNSKFQAWKWFVSIYNVNLERFDKWSKNQCKKENCHSVFITHTSPSILYVLD